MAKTKTNKLRAGDFFCDPLALVTRDRAREKEDREREGKKYQYRERYVADGEKIYPVMLKLLKGGTLPRAEYLGTYHARLSALADSSGWDLIDKNPDKLSPKDRAARAEVLELARTVFTACLHAAVCDAHPDSAESTSGEWHVSIAIAWTNRPELRL